jgi:hypothetical protein
MPNRQQPDGLSTRAPASSKNVLSPDRALVFRMTHVSNVPWMLANGLHSRLSGARDPGYVAIGNPELVEKRDDRAVPVPPGGTLSDYVPFYFTPYSSMLRHIRTGRSGIVRRPMAEIVILVSSLPTFAAAGIPFVFTDQHASLVTASFFTSLADLPRLDWPLWQTHDVQRDLRDPDRLARHMAEALAYRHVPVAALQAVACYGQDEQDALEDMMRRAAARIEIVRRPEWFL